MDWSGQATYSLWLDQWKQSNLAFSSINQFTTHIDTFTLQAKYHLNGWPGHTYRYSLQLYRHGRHTTIEAWNRGLDTHYASLFHIFTFYCPVCSLQLNHLNWTLTLQTLPPWAWSTITAGWLIMSESPCRPLDEEWSLLLYPLELSPWSLTLASWLGNDRYRLPQAQEPIERGIE